MLNTLWVWGPTTEGPDSLFEAIWEPNVKSVSAFRASKLSDLARSIKKKVQGEKEIIYVIYSSPHDATIGPGGQLSSLKGRPLSKEEIREFGVAFTAR